MKSITKTVLSAVNVANNQTSEAIDLRFNYGVFVQAALTGSPTGDIVLQASNDLVTWTELDKVTISTTSHFINKDAIYAPYVRIYKAAGGTGTMSVTVTVKGA
jgi:hypothetical protein